MKTKLFITGGARSGKSRYALERSSELVGEKIFIATAEALDEEMQARIDAHRSERGEGWRTVEEPKDIAGRIASCSPNDVVLIDCLGLWVNNTLAHDENSFDRLVGEFIGTLESFKGSVVVVSNETGMGIVPADPATRKFRDRLGRLNRMAVSVCDEAAFMVCGMPLWLKGSFSDTGNAGI